MPSKPTSTSQSEAMLDAALALAKTIGVPNVLVLVERMDRKVLAHRLPKGLNLVFVVTDEDAAAALKEKGRQVALMPAHELRRADRIKHALLAALSDKFIHRRDRVVCVMGTRELDSISVVSMARDEEEQAPLAMLDLRDETSNQVGESCLSLAIELGYEGREGKSVGSIFVIGDSDKVMASSRQLVFNPFHGYPVAERNVLDPFVREAIKEFAMIDGGFVLRSDGTILAAGRYFDVGKLDKDMPQGLGARHAAAAAVTKRTAAIAIVVSESNGAVRVFKKGKIVLDMEQQRRLGA